MLRSAPATPRATKTTAATNPAAPCIPTRIAARRTACGGGDVKAYNKKAAKVPFRIFHGDVDGVIPVKHSREMTERLKALGADVVYTEYPDVNHNSWEKAYAEPWLLEWMFGCRK